MIVHYYDSKFIHGDIIINQYFLKLYRKFCPGPITFILRRKKNSKIGSLVTANLNTIAIRFPKHKITRAVLKNLNFPLAMPSANLSSGLSPVNASDVFDEFKKKLKIIIDGGKSKFGIESTVIDLTGIPRILRPGIISSDKIKKTLKINLSNKKKKKLSLPEC